MKVDYDWNGSPLLSDLPIKDCKNVKALAMSCMLLISHEVELMINMENIEKVP